MISNGLGRLRILGGPSGSQCKVGAFSLPATAVGPCIGLAAIDDATRPSDLARPGHIFPLRARPGGVLVRAGQTEASVDLARMAGLTPAGVICEIMNEDGTMARVPQLMAIAERFHLKIVTIKDLIHYRMQRESLVRVLGETTLPLRVGTFRALAFENEINQD